MKEGRQQRGQTPFIHIHSFSRRRKNPLSGALYQSLSPGSVYSSLVDMQRWRQNTKGTLYSTITRQKWGNSPATRQAIRKVNSNEIWVEGLFTWMLEIPFQWMYSTVSDQAMNWVLCVCISVPQFINSQNLSSDSYNTFTLSYKQRHCIDYLIKRKS